jgi:hypothetical protein
VSPNASSTGPYVRMSVFRGPTILSGAMGYGMVINGSNLKFSMLLVVACTKHPLFIRLDMRSSIPLTLGNCGLTLGDGTIVEQLALFSSQ